MYFIIDSFSRFIDARGELPDLKLFPVHRSRAHKFASKGHADATLAAIKELFPDFKGRVITEQDANEMIED